MADVTFGSVKVFGDSNGNVMFGEGQHNINLSTVNGEIVVTD